MDPQVSNSFIPKKPLVPTRSSGSLSGLLLLVSILMFMVSLAGAGGAFLYERYLIGAIAAKDLSLERAQAAYEPETVQALIRLDSRINESKSLLNKHIAPSAIFNFLALKTLEKVQLTSFDYQVDDGGTASLQLVGIADSFSTLALQSDEFGSTDVLRNVIFSDIVIQPENGKVSFSVYADIDPASIVYSKNMESRSVMPLPEETDQGTTTTPVSAPNTQ